MRHHLIRVLPLVFIAVLLQTTPSQAWLKNLLDNVVRGGSTRGALTDGEIARGMQDALRVGAERAVAAVGRTDGYFGEPAIRIELPPAVANTEKLLRAAGFGGPVDQFRLSMNRAAEQAAPQATAIFLDAIRDMTFSDVRSILQGADNAATVYFREKTEERLSASFSPVVNRAMATVQVTEAFQTVQNRVKAIPFAGQLVNVDLDQYVTARALDGLFHMLAAEEARIRHDPAARATALLKRVFGGAK